MPPIACRYYKCTNGGIGIIIWPAIRKPDGGHDVLWNGRDKGGYKLYINESVVVDLANTGIAPGTQFILAEDTLLGTDYYDVNQIFYYDPSSKVITNGIKYGGSLDGGLYWAGIQSKVVNALSPIDSATEIEYDLTADEPARVIVPMAEEFTNYANLVAYDKVSEILDAQAQHRVAAGLMVINRWKAIIAFTKAYATPANIGGGVLTIMQTMVLMGYGVEKKETKKPDDSVVVEFKFGPLHPPNLGDVPDKVKRDWQKAVGPAVKKFHAIDKGVTDIKKLAENGEAQPNGPALESAPASVAVEA